MANKTNKVTEKEIYASIKAAMEGGEWAYDTQTYIDFCDKKIDALDRKAAKAKADAEKKKAEGDALQDAVYAVLGSEFETAKAIAARVEFGDEEVSAAKVQYRLRQLVANGKAVSEDIKVEENGKSKVLKGYKLA